MFAVVYARTRFIILAQEGRRAPKADIIANFAGLGRRVANKGLRAALKADRSAGGDGARIVPTNGEDEGEVPEYLPRAATSLWHAPSGARATRDRWQETTWGKLI